MKNQLLNLKMIALMCLMMVLGGANVWAQETVTIWSEDWTGQKADATPSSINSMYSQANSNTRVFSEKVAGGVAPELLLQGNDKWTINISDLKGCSGEFTLSYHSNKSKSTLTVKVNNKSVSVSADQSDKKLYKGTFNVEKGTSNIIIAFSTTSNARIDDIVLTGTKAQTKKLTSLAISGTPKKTTYNVGEEFDPEGLVVTGTYEDNTTATITNGITWTMNPATLSLSDVSCSVTATVDGITSPAYNVTGLTVNEAKVPSVIFYESFDKNDGTGGNDGEWKGNIAKNALKLDNSEWRISNGKGASKCAKIGSGSKGTATTPSIDLSAGDAVLAFKAGAWNTDNEKTSIIVSVDNGKLAYNGKVASEQTITLKKGEFSDYTMTISGGTSATKITFTAIQDKNNRFFLDEVMVSKVAAAEPTYKETSLTLKATDGSLKYSTFSSDKVTFFPGAVFPLAVTVNGNIIEQDYNVFKEETVTIDSKTVKGWFVPANTGVMLMSDDADVTYYTVDNYTVAALTAGANMLKPAPANGGEFTAENGYKYYKLAYDNFDNKTGLGFYWGADNGGAFKVKAGTAYLAVPAGENTAKGFTLNGEATGIDGVNANVENAKAIYNLNGQRVASMAKPGLYIVNGKKVVRK